MEYKTKPDLTVTVKMVQNAIMLLRNSPQLELSKTTLQSEQSNNKKSNPQLIEIIENYCA